MQHHILQFFIHVLLLLLRHVVVVVVNDVTDVDTTVSMSTFPITKLVSKFVLCTVSTGKPR